MPLTLLRFAGFSIAFALLVSIASAQTVVQVLGPDDGVKEPFSIAFNAKDVPYFVEMQGGDKFCKIDDNGKMVVVAEGIFKGMHDLVIAPDGMIYLADTFNHRIWSYNPITLKLEPFAGTGKEGYLGDGFAATKAELKQPICLALSNDAKTLYLVDGGNFRLRAIDLDSGRIESVAGNGRREMIKKGQPALGNPLFDPRAVTVDKEGNIYILERSGNKLVMIDIEGKIHHVAGTGSAGKGGNDGPALKASFNGPKYVIMDNDGGVLIADTENHQIRKYDPKTKTVSLVAGVGKAGKGGVGGDPLKLEMNRPHGVVRHPTTGELWIADSSNNRILKITK